jgi:F-type H+-transporting ATPase subunit b
MFNEKFWLAIAFFSFLGLLIKFVFPKIAKNLDAQSKKIAEDILEAKKLREGAQKLLEEAQIFHKYSIEHSQKIITDAIEEAKKIEINSKKSLEDQIKKVSDIALERLKSEEESAIRQVKINIINEAIEQFSTIKFKDDEQNKIIEKALEKISKIQ